MLKNLILALIWACQTLIWATIFRFFSGGGEGEGFTLLNVPSCNPMQYQGKLIKPKKPDFGPYFGLSCFFCKRQQLDIVPSHYPMQLQIKIKKKSLRTWRETKFSIWFWSVQPKFGLLKFFSWVLSQCYKLWQAVIVCNFKENVWSKLKKNLMQAMIQVHWTQMRVQIQRKVE